MDPPMTNPEAALRSSQDPSFGTARTDVNDDVQILAREEALEYDGELW